MQIEREVLGVDHADLGAMYLRKQGMAEAYVEIVRFHHAPASSRYQTKVTASVHLADLLVRHGKIGDSGNHAEVPVDSWMESPAWPILFGRQTAAGREEAQSSLKWSLERIPGMVESLV